MEERMEIDWKKKRGGGKQACGGKVVGGRKKQGDNNKSRQKTETEERLKDEEKRRTRTRKNRRNEIKEHCTRGEGGGSIMWDSLLKKSFRASKCKTLLRLAMARIKLFRNKRDIQVKQLRKEISQLLASGQEPSARIRVEHVIREENILAAYDTLELFCELVAVRLPIIESQKLCPIDLKEPITSLIFAAPRCADLPELLQMHSLFSAKYGKEFVTAAAELRPDCGVNRRIIEKLSVTTPSGVLKLKLLKEIATEHNVKWDSTSAEADLLKVPQDLLDGPDRLLDASGKEESESVPVYLPKDGSPDLTSSTQLSSRHSQPDTSLANSPPKDYEKQFVPFGKMPPPGKYDDTPPPLLSQDSQKKGHKVMKDLDLKSASNTKKGAYEEMGDEEMEYPSVAAAAKAAAASADRAVAAARAAAGFAKRSGGLPSTPLKQNVAMQEDSSETELDSDSDDGGDKEPPKLEASRGQYASDMEARNELNVPNSKPQPSLQQSWSRGSYGELEPETPKFSMTSKKPVFDDDNENLPDHEDSLFYSSMRTGQQRSEHRDAWPMSRATKNRTYSGAGGTSGKHGDGVGESKNGILRWYSKHDDDAEEPEKPYSSFGGTEYYFGKHTLSNEEHFHNNDETKSEKPYAGDRWLFNSGKQASTLGHREGSPLFMD